MFTLRALRLLCGLSVKFFTAEDTEKAQRFTEVFIKRELHKKKPSQLRNGSL